jgi:hypothetical protein
VYRLHVTHEFIVKVLWQPAAQPAHDVMPRYYSSTYMTNGTPPAEGKASIGCCFTPHSPWMRVQRAGGPAL